ncbi:MAG: AfsR/SARP family transcriptional regulator, partial [Acidimicrobiaceae bacterium]|nr:AfsR/SARP family transcriptional regulator [Acidimicrobiaceae bacterium]
MEVQLLGSLAVSVDGAPVSVKGAKERAVLSLLALRAGSAVSVDELIEGLWGPEPPRSAMKALHNYVSNIRRVLPAGSVVTVPGGYRAGWPPEHVDALRFERAIVNARRALATDPSASAAILQETLALWRGSPLVDLTGSSLGIAEATRLAELRRGAEEDLFDARLAAGEHGEVVADLELAVRREPLRERRWAQLMLALYRSGRQGEALRAFTRLSKVLAEELGIGPSAELCRLETDILHQAPSLRPGTEAGPSRTAGRSTPLPGGLLRAARRELIGRRRESTRL